jgi:hypothetical protein
VSASETYFATLFLSAATLLFSYAAYVLLSDYIRLAREPSVRTYGQVIKYDKLYDDGARYFVLSIQFEDSAGLEHVITDQRGSFPAPYVGERVRVTYLSADPSRAWVPKPFWVAVHVAVLAAFPAYVLFAVFRAALS